MHFKPEKVIGVLELEDTTEFINKVVSPIEAVMPDTIVRTLQSRDRVKWNSPLVKDPIVGGVT
jgi:hypothetical protein